MLLTNIIRTCYNVSMKTQGTGPGAISEKELKKLLREISSLEKDETASSKQKLYAGMAKPLLHELVKRVNDGDLSKISSGRLVDLLMSILRELKQTGDEPKGPVNVKAGKIGNIEERAPQSIGLSGISDLGRIGIPGQNKNN